MHNFRGVLQRGWTAKVTTRYIPWISRRAIVRPMPRYVRRRIKEAGSSLRKDDDFIYSFLTLGEPERLLLVSTGNIGNADLLALFRSRMTALKESFSDYRLVELTKSSILVHE